MPIDWQVTIAHHAAYFFSTRRLAQTYTHAKTVVPASATEFVTYLKDAGLGDQWVNAWAIDRLLRAMVREGLLVHYVGQDSSPFLRGSYLFMGSVTESQRHGVLWLAPVFGAALLATTIGSVTMPITGTDAAGDVHIGSGLILDETHILTCAHVVTDMQVDAQMQRPTQSAPLVPPPDGSVVRVANIACHERHDLAVITIDVADGARGLVSAAGMAFRDPDWADRVFVFGYPRVPTATSAALVVQSGEIANPHVDVYDGSELFLFSATARPGNSGGPIVATDGRIVGLVTRELTTDGGPPASPFHSGLPASVIVDALADLGMTNLVTLETWD